MKNNGHYVVAVRRVSKYYALTFIALSLVMVGFQGTNVQPTTNV